MFKIGFRTIKTALGTAVSIFIAEMLSLDNFLSAGILTVLCIQNTKRKSMKTAWDRFLACQIGMLFSLVFFELLGYNPISIGLLILFFFPTVVMVKAKGGIVTSTVIILHFYAAENFTMELLINEYKLIIVGIGVALLVNMYMPSVEKVLKDQQVELEENFRIIFLEIANYLRTNDLNWDGKEILKTAELLKTANNLSYRSVENYLLRNEDYYFNYFKMREKQFEIIERVLPIVTSISKKVEQAHIVADLIEEIGESIQPKSSGNKFLNKLAELKKELNKMELPKNNEEFEALASLTHFVKEMEQYLIIKKSFI